MKILSLFLLISPLLFLSAYGTADEASSAKQLLKNVSENNLTKVKHLLKTNTANIEAQNSLKETALFIASALGYQKMIETLLHHGANPNLFNKFQVSPLDVAVLEQNFKALKTLVENERSAKEIKFKALLSAITQEEYEMVRYLIEKGVYLEGKDSLVFKHLFANNNPASKVEYNSSFHLKRDLIIAKILAYLIKHTSLNANELIQDLSPLQIASITGFEKTALVLIEEGADINFFNAQFSAPLLTALENNLDSLIETLIKKKADITVTDLSGLDALHYALRSGSIKWVEYFLNNGLDFNSKNHFGITSLMSAILSDSDEALDFVLKKKASDINAKDKVLGSTALYQAVNNKSFKKVEMLLKNGADPNIPNTNKLSPLHIATHLNLEDTIILLLNNGADVNAKDSKDHAPIAYMGTQDLPALSKKALRALLKAGADPNAKLKAQDGYIPIIQNFFQRNPEKEILEILLEAGADINATDSGGFTILHHVYARGFFEIGKFLEKNGANRFIKSKTGVTPERLEAEQKKQGNDSCAKSFTVH